MEHDPLRRSCSFCGHSARFVGPLVAGDRAFICADCADRGARALARHGAADAERRRTPRQLKVALDEAVIGQEEAKRLLSVAVYSHYKAVRRDAPDNLVGTKGNVLLIGPTGCGKTLLAQQLATILSVPLVTIDVTGLTEAGYVGEDVTQIVQRMLHQADGDVAAAATGIVYLDEVDKLAQRGGRLSAGKDVSGEGVQQALLKIIEGTTVTVPTGPAGASVDVNTDRMLFLAGGAFPELDRIVSRRARSGSLGFTATTTDGRAGQPTGGVGEVLSQDLVEFGLLPEFLGRFPVLARLDRLDIPALLKVLSATKNSLIRYYTELVRLDGHDVLFSAEALHELAVRAYATDTGARALRGQLEHLLNAVLFEGPELPPRTFRIDRTDVVAGSVTVERSDVPDGLHAVPASSAAG